jgi:hypothetical protein
MSHVGKQQELVAATVPRATSSTPRLDARRNERSRALSRGKEARSSRKITKCEIEAGYGMLAITDRSRKRTHIESEPLDYMLALAYR